MAFFLGPFSGRDFGQVRVRPNCRASPLFAKNCDQKMVAVLGIAGGRLHFEPRIRAQAALLFLAFLIRSRLVHGSWLVE